MKIRRLSVANFRGIKKLSWHVQNDVACLIGAGDSTKSSILNAISYALWPYYNLTLDDYDFHGADSNNSISIEVTVSELPESILDADKKFGLHIKGYKDGVLRDEPTEDDEPALTIRLSVTNDLEPVWTVVNDRAPEGVFISASDRARLSASVIGDFLDRDFTWARGTHLNRLTTDPEKPNTLLAESIREIRIGANEKMASTQMSDAAETVKKEAAKYGVRLGSDLAPGLDGRAINISAGGISLHSERIPLRLYGLGSRRLLSIAMQRLATPHGAVTLIDEVEHALEPHRIVKLLQLLTTAVNTRGQVILTTHSVIPILHLKTSQLGIVRNDAGNISVTQVPDSVTAIRRKHPEAFLAKSVLVCEGKTEVGFIRAIDEFRASTNKPSFGLLGMEAVEGTGSDAPSQAIAFASIGFRTALLADSDVSLTHEKSEIEGAGVALFQWNGNVSIEERLFLDLPLPSVKKLIKLALEKYDKETIRAHISTALVVPMEGMPHTVDGLIETYGEPRVRAALGKASISKKKPWFKTIDGGYAVGKIVTAALDGLDGTNLMDTLSSIQAWIDS